MKWQKPPAPLVFLPPAATTTKCLPTHKYPAPNPPPSVPGCGGSQRGIISHQGGAMLLQTLL